MNTLNKTDRAWRIVARDIDGSVREFVVARWKLTRDHILELNEGDDYMMDIAWMRVEAWT